MGAFFPRLRFRLAVVTALLAAASAAFAASVTAPAKRLVRIGVDLNSPPLSSVGPDGQPQGFTADLLAAIAADSDLSFQLVPAHWREQLNLFETGQLDALANVHYLASREARMDFSIGHAHLYGVAYVPLGAKPIRRKAELAGKEIGVLRESLGHTKALLDGGWGGTVTDYPNLPAALAALRSGEIDVFVGQSIWSTNFVAEGLRTDFIEDLTFNFRIAVQKGDSALLRRLNDRLHDLHNEGVIRELYEKWIRPVDRQPLRWRDVRPYALAAGVLLGGFAVFLFRFYRQRVIRTERARIARELHEELASRLAEVQRLTAGIPAAAAVDAMPRLRRLQDDTGAALEELIGLLDPPPETWAQSLAQLERRARLALQAATGGTVAVQAAAECARRPAQAPARHLLFRTTRELVRHLADLPPRSPLRIQIELLAASARLTVITVGPQPEAAAALGLGRALEPLQNRLAEVGGELLLLQTAAGFTAQAELPLNP